MRYKPGDLLLFNKKLKYMVMYIEDECYYLFCFRDKIIKKAFKTCTIDKFHNIKVLSRGNDIKGLYSLYGSVDENQDR